MNSDVTTRGTALARGGLKGIHRANARRSEGPPEGRDVPGKMEGRVS